MKRCSARYGIISCNNIRVKEEDDVESLFEKVAVVIDLQIYCLTGIVK